MKFSCLPVSLYDDFTAGRRTLADWFRLAAALGLDGADISVAHVPSWEPVALDALRGQAAAAGVQIAMLVTYADFTHPDADERQRQINQVHDYVIAAAQLGAPFLRVTAGQAHPGVACSDGVQWATHGLTANLDVATRAGVTLVYENHTKGSVWTYDDFSRPADIFLEIVAQTAGSGLQILYDTANTLGHGDDPLAVLEEVKHRVAVVHVNDIRRAGHFEPVVVGTGVAPIAEIFARLAQDGFDGWISVEEAGMQGEAGFRAAIPYTKRAWYESAERLR